MLFFDMNLTNLMRKYFKNIPARVLRKLSEIASNKIVIATVLQLTREDVKDGKFSHLGIVEIDGQISIPETIIPSEESGKFSHRNRNERVLIRKDLGLINPISHEMPIYGDWSKGSFTMVRMCYQRDKIPPANLSLRFKRFPQLEGDDKCVAILVVVESSLDKTAVDFKAQALERINILFENTRQVDVYPENPTLQDLITATKVVWKIFPFPDVDTATSIVVTRRGIVTPEQRQAIQNRMRVLHSYGPSKLIIGQEGFDGYSGALFTGLGDVAVFENDHVGNALYVILENWQALSKLSRTELRAHHADKIIRIRHVGNWQAKLDEIMRSLLPANAA